jgi:uncharacterized protein (DUF433 family)
MPARRTSGKSVSLRVASSTLDDLDRLARQSGMSRNALAERYLAEGVRRQEFPEVTFRDGALGRRATLVGTRLDVWQVVETVRAHGNAVEDAAAYLSLPVDRVRAATRYYAAHREEVDEIATREIEAAEREESLWRAEQELLAS